MTLTLSISALALILAFAVPPRWGVVGFLGIAMLLFAVQAGISTSLGFAGATFEESLLLFNGSVLSYVGFNLQITYRAFAIPLLVLGAAMVYRLSLSRN